MNLVAKRRRIALVTAREAQALDEDLPPLADALHHAGVDVHVVPWDAMRDWSQFDMLLLRSTWDYMSRLTDFLGWAEQASRATRLVNSLETVRWNIDKHYLGTLAAAGCRWCRRPSWSRKRMRPPRSSSSWPRTRARNS